MLRVYKKITAVKSKWLA